MSGTPTPALRWLPAVVSLGLLLTGCGGSSGASDSSTAGSSTSAGAVGQSGTGTEAPAARSKPVKPPPPAPITGECRDLSHADISRFSNATQPQPCAKPHTAYTFAVPTLAASVAFDGVQIKNTGVQTAAADRCRSAFVTFIGGDEETRALSRITVTYFLPRQQGFDLGAHWVRCDVVALQSADALGPLPGKVAGFLDTPGALDQYAVCSTDDPGAATSALVMCAESHTYRAVAALRLGTPDAAYPGTSATLDSGKQRCKQIVAQQLGRTTGFTYSWTYPSSEDWAAGQRFGYCWNATTR